MRGDHSRNLARHLTANGSKSILQMPGYAKSIGGYCKCRAKPSAGGEKGGIANIQVRKIVGPIHAIEHAGLRVQAEAARTAGMRQRPVHSGAWHDKKTIPSKGALQGSAKLLQP
jgi:hypothetical protein